MRNARDFALMFGRGVTVHNAVNPADMLPIVLPESTIRFHGRRAWAWRERVLAKQSNCRDRTGADRVASTRPLAAYGLWPYCRPPGLACVCEILLFVVHTDWLCFGLCECRVYFVSA